MRNTGGDAMCDESDNAGRISLSGDWSMTGVARQLPRLVQLLARIAAGDQKPAPRQLLLEGITELDACGCQLLASFVRELRRQGISPLCAGLPEGYREKVRLLGFAAELGDPPALHRGCP